VGNRQFFYLIFVSIDEFLHLLFKFGSFLSQQPLQIFELVRRVALQRLYSGIKFFNGLLQPLYFSQFVRIVLVVGILHARELQSHHFVLLLKILNFVLEHIDLSILLRQLSLIKISHGVELSVFER